ncbi:hypothetical protein MGYG_06076 [Nannizzia gypsea CBS 118893]|uniref:Non-homologous end-joining factor 1 n=1 Tax=Arthroderma gypseum (strain ATCC MYA-4604 / CBS 118893) TaxID=535722 RepID=E4V0E2_ARTGP|nr:hypothetical protein MGYG_06076 [Nannizzia gypsea CBS 118893]EFR03079.1 hypothetical protein MGYG_06076 [Nannizzia gypsea CBS 118893]
MARNWERLPVHSSSYPPLLFSYEPSSDGYELFLTDLGHVWSESLSHKQIINRAVKEDTSIDPSQDEDQYSVLLQKINDALHGSKETSLCLSGHSTGSSLKLSTTTKLPKPLEPLKWTLNLSKCSPSALTRHMLVPTLQSWLGLEDSQQSLCELLEEKDKIIGKLFDKIESSGLDLSTVFPGMANIRQGQKRGSLFSHASRLVKGLSPFDKSSWEAVHYRRVSEKFGSNSIRKHLYDDDLFDVRNMELIESEWWNRPISSRGSNHTGKEVPHDIKRQPKNNENESDDEFQRQETPPRLKGTSIKPSSTITGHPSSTQHGNKHKRSSQESGSLKDTGSMENMKTETPSIIDYSNPEPTPRQEIKPKALGNIGGKKPKSLTRQQGLDPATLDADKAVNKPTESSMEDQATPLATESGESDDNDDDVNDKRVSRTTRQALHQQNHSGSQRTNTTTQIAQRESQAALRTRSGLGRIGGKKQKEPLDLNPGGEEAASAASSRDKTDSPEAGEEDGGRYNITSKQEEPDLSHGHKEQSTTSSKSCKRSGKLGTIGGVKASHKSAMTNVQGRNASNTEISQDSEDGGHHDTNKLIGKEGDPTNPSLSLPSMSSTTGEPKAESNQVKEESPEERADRKRQELRRQLETADKGQSKPAKKKRRF